MSAWDDAAAQWYADRYGEYATNRLAVDALDLGDDDVIVDVGCGAGPALRHASTRMTGGRLIGVEPTPRMLAIAIERAADHPAGDRLEFVAGPAEALPVDDAVADWVFLFDVFDHLADPPRALAEIARVLQPKGRLVVVKDAVPTGPVPFEATVERAGFVNVDRVAHRDDEVAFTRWVFARA